MVEPVRVLTAVGLRIAELVGDALGVLAEVGVRVLVGVPGSLVGVGLPVRDQVEVGV